MKKRIFANIFVTSLVSVVMVALLVVGVLYGTMDEREEETLYIEAGYIASGYEVEGIAYLERTKGFVSRMTLIAPDGSVLFDDEGAADEMENHLARPEVKKAFESGSGEAYRRSETLSTTTIYYAMRLKDGNVLRVSSTADSALVTVMDVVPLLLLATIVVAILALFLAQWQTKKLVSPLNELDLDKPLENDAYPELSPLLRRIESQQKEISDSLAELKLRQHEFETITSRMNEGLVLLDSRGVVLTVNKSAASILRVQGDGAGLHLLEINRDIELERTVKRAIDGERAEMVLRMDNRRYQVSASPVPEGEGGVVLFITDATEKLQAEDLRREFSANVSHELKTPLTSISGYAEIIKNGMVQPEDVPIFAGRIYDESNRMIALVQDIIRISRLDEKRVEEKPEEVDLLQLSQNVATRLEALAKSSKVTVEVIGEPTPYKGVRTILEEIIYNLCENAIKYNSEQGHVQIQVIKQSNGVEIHVKDNGIGIAPAEQQRIFERFYRIDKSHSKETGGTGLGLSIVKHGVLYHGGRIEVESEIGKGTDVIVYLPD